ncbi:MAG: hypothetical protein RSB11_04910 [Oscillospiraceae bacterium]
MSLLFSKVKVTADEDWRATSFLVGGKPSKINDLEGWTEFENFLEALEDNECELKFKVQSFLYGDGESVTASPEEIAYLMTKGDGLFNSVLLKLL